MVPKSEKAGKESCGKTPAPSKIATKPTREAVYTERPLQVLLVDDHPMLRGGIRRLIEEQRWEICGEAANGREAVVLAEELKPDIAVIDIQMPELNGLEATKQIKKRLPSCEVLVFSSADSRETVLKAFDAGARAFLPKTEIGTHFVAALQSLAQHKPYFTPEIAEIVFERFAGPGPKLALTGEASLTDREREVIQLLAEGCSNKDVANKLGINLRTAECHRASVMDKLKLASFADLVRYAIRSGMIEP